MAEGKKRIIVYQDWLPVFEKLSDEEAGLLAKHFFRYVNDLNPIAPNRIVEIAFEHMKQTLKRDLEGYKQTCDNNSGYAKNRWKKGAHALVEPGTHAELADNDGDADPENVKFNFKKTLLQAGADKKKIEDWIKVRKTKRLANTETALQVFFEEVKKTKHSVGEMVKMCAEKSWGGFKASWLDNINNSQYNNSQNNGQQETTRTWKDVPG